MNIDVSLLNRNIENVIEFNETYSFSKEQLVKTDIISAKDINVKGYIRKINDSYYIEMSIIGTITIPCSVNLKPTLLSINTMTEGIYEEMLNEIGLFPKKNENSLDILPLIWENILMEIPIRVECPEYDNVENQELLGEQNNSVFARLKDLL